MFRPNLINYTQLALLTMCNQICHVDEKHNPPICETAGKYVERN